MFGKMIIYRNIYKEKGNLTYKKPEDMDTDVR